jgi:ubiquinone/menaquinone biosynthesis C-methylase UbiE
VARDRDVDAFDRRAESYDRGPLGTWHRLVVERTASIALAAVATPTRVLDVGCGTGLLLELLAARLPETVELAGVDPAQGMVARSRERLVGDRRVAVEHAAAELLPFDAGSFDLMVSSMSFDHWKDQPAGLAECRRVLRDDGRLVVADLLAGWLGRRRRARTVPRASRLFPDAGLRPLGWERVYDLGPLRLVQAVVAEAAG